MGFLKDYGFSERFALEAELYPELSPARVTAQHKGLYNIVTESGECSCEISGRFRYETAEMVEFPTVGDFVMVKKVGGGSNAIIQHVLSRKSIFMRTAVGLTGQAQPVVTNVDIVFICMSLNNNFNLSRLERYLGVAWDSKATPVIILTKSDLCDDVKSYIDEAERVSLYSDVIALSIFDDIDEKLSPYLEPGTTVAFIGSSGVGKSTIINKLLGDDIVLTADISKDDKGRHTTTGKQMYCCSNGSVLIDTPGMRELGVQTVDLSSTFDEIEKLTMDCKFSDCTHSNEKGCAILKALSDGLLEKRRFENYLKLKAEAGYEGLSSREIEEKKFARFGGVKKIRKIGDAARDIKYRNR